MLELVSNEEKHMTDDDLYSNEALESISFILTVLKVVQLIYVKGSLVGQDERKNVI